MYISLFFFFGTGDILRRYTKSPRGDGSRYYPSEERDICSLCDGEFRVDFIFFQNPVTARNSKVATAAPLRAIMQSGFLLFLLPLSASPSFL